MAGRKREGEGGERKIEGGSEASGEAEGKYRRVTEHDGRGG